METQGIREAIQEMLRKKGLTSTMIISQTTQRDSMTGISAPSVSASIFKEQEIEKYMGLSKLT